MPKGEARFFFVSGKLEIEFVSEKIRKGCSRVKLTLVVLYVLEKLEYEFVRPIFLERQQTVKPDLEELTRLVGRVPKVCKH